MILEIADMLIQPGRQAEFEQALDHGLRTVHSKAAGRRGWQVYHSIETPERYVMAIRWDSIDAHNAYRQGTVAPEMRALLTPFYARGTQMEHFDLLSEGP